MKTEMICAGFGGQGMLSLGQVVAYAGMYDGKSVSWLPSYGPEMRGGTANCSVVVSDDEVANPMITRPDIVVAMNKPSVAKFVDTIVPGGYIFVNSSLIDTKVERDDINVVYVDTFKIAHDGGNPELGGGDEGENIIGHRACRQQGSFLALDELEIGARFAQSTVGLQGAGVAQGCHAGFVETVIAVAHVVLA